VDNGFLGNFLNYVFELNLKEITMKLTPPKKVTFYISLIFGVLSVLFLVVKVPFVSDFTYAIMTVAWILMILGVAFKGF